MACAQGARWPASASWLAIEGDWGTCTALCVTRLPANSVADVQQTSVLRVGECSESGQAYSWSAVTGLDGGYVDLGELHLILRREVARLTGALAGEALACSLNLQFCQSAG